MREPFGLLTSNQLIHKYIAEFHEEEHADLEN